MYISIGTRPFPSPLCPVVIAKATLVGQKGRREGTCDVRYLYSHALTVTYPQTIPQAVDNSDRSTPDVVSDCVRMKGRDPVPVQRGVGKGKGGVGTGLLLCVYRTYLHLSNKSLRASGLWEAEDGHRGLTDGDREAKYPITK
jgi:hypothetical protein